MRCHTVGRSGWLFRDPRRRTRAKDVCGLSSAAVFMVAVESRASCGVMGQCANGVRKLEPWEMLGVAGGVDLRSLASGQKPRRS